MMPKASSNGSPLAHSPGLLRLRVLGALVLQEGKASTTAIQDELGVRSVRTVEITLGRLEADGYAKKVAPGRWVATTQGRKYAALVCGWLGCC